MAHYLDDRASRAANEQYYKQVENNWKNTNNTTWARNQEKRFNNRFKPFHKQSRQQYEQSYLKQKRFELRKARTLAYNWKNKRQQQLEQRKTWMRQLALNRNRKQRGTWKTILNRRLYTYPTQREKYIYNEVKDISRAEAAKMNEVREITNLARQGLI